MAAAGDGVEGPEPTTAPADPSPPAQPARRPRRRTVLLAAAVGVALVVAALAWSARSGSQASEKFCTLGLPISTVDGVTVMARDNDPFDPRCMRNGQEGEPDTVFAGVIELDCTITWQPGWTGPRPATYPPLRPDGTCGDGWDE